jgi:molybdopterin synthase catalytic subunit
MVMVTTIPIDVEEIIRAVSTPRSGGLDVFIGTVRNHSQGKRVRHLEYSAYIPMAEKVMRAIEEEIKSKWIVDAVAIVHRVGVLQVGEIAVVAAVSAPHRKEAFEACRDAIEKVKAIVPIWKKEHFEDGLAWVVGQHEVDITGHES